MVPNVLKQQVSNTNRDSTFDQITMSFSLDQNVIKCVWADGMHRLQNFKIDIENAKNYFRCKFFQSNTVTSSNPFLT